MDDQGMHNSIQPEPALSGDDAEDIVNDDADQWSAWNEEPANICIQPSLKLLDQDKLGP